MGFKFVLKNLAILGTLFDIIAKSKLASNLLGLCEQLCLSMSFP